MRSVEPRWIRGPADERAIEQGCYFDEEAGRFVVDFIQTFCRQSKGRWSGQPLTLLDWQVDFLMRLFGWKRPNGLRRFTRAYMEVAKKNGKSTIVSALLLYFLLGDGEGAPECYCNACDRDQASIVFDEAARMVRASPELSMRLQVIDSRKLIVDPVGHGKIRANSAESGSKDGLNPHVTIFDELHRQKNSDLWEVFEYAAAAREQPLTISITTAGEDTSGVWHEQRQYSEDIIAGRVADISHLGVVYRADPKDDLDDPAVWRKANPSLGETIDEAKFRAEWEEAKQVPRKRANFLRLRLNVIAAGAAKFVDPEIWKENGLVPVDPAALAGAPCWAGLDLSSTNDLTALALVFGDRDEGFDVLMRYWLPGDNIAELEAQHRRPYRAWADAGLITLTPGNVVDYAFIRREINDLAGAFALRKLLADPFNATQLTLEMRESDGLPIENLRQGFLSLSDPTKQLDRLIRARKVRHGGHPILSWNAENAAVVADTADNIKLSKKRAAGKIDGLAALVNAIAATSGDDAGPSVYETRGLLTL